MQIEAIYENGIIKPATSLRLKGKRVKVQIIIPDDSLVDPKAEINNTMREQIHKIMGRYSRNRQPVSPDQNKAVWHEHIERKYRK